MYDCVGRAVAIADAIAARSVGGRWRSSKHDLPSLGAQGKAGRTLGLRWLRQDWIVVSAAASPSTVAVARVRIPRKPQSFGG